jgi:hypothetical protein
MNTDKQKLKILIAKIQALRRLIEDWDSLLPATFTRIIKPILEDHKEIENE